MTITFQQSVDEVAQLVKQFNTNRPVYMAATYREAAARTNLIDPLFMALSLAIVVLVAACAPPPNPSRIATEVGPTRTPAPRFDQIGTQAPLSPTTTLIPISKTTDRAPALPEDQKTKLYVKHADGSYELILIDPNTKVSDYLLPGDIYINSIPPNPAARHQVPTYAPPVPVTPAVTRAPYPLPTR